MFKKFSGLWQVKKSQTFFPIHVYQKRGSKFQNFTNSCFWGPPVANFLTLYNWGSGQFAQCTRKKFMVIFAGGPPPLGIQTPSTCLLTVLIYLLKKQKPIENEEIVQKGYFHPELMPRHFSRFPYLIKFLAIPTLMKENSFPIFLTLGCKSQFYISMQKAIIKCLQY